MTGLVCSTELARLSGLTYRRVDRWTAERVLMPTVAATGTGSRRLYPASEVHVATVLARYVGAVGDVDVRRLACIARALRAADTDWVRIGRTIRVVAAPAAEDGAVYLSTR